MLKPLLLPALLLCLWTMPQTTRAETTTLSYDGLMEYLIEQRGKVVIVDFWATWCGPCLKEMPSFIQLRKEYPPEKLVIIGISLDYDVNALNTYLQKHPINFTTFHADPDLMSLLKIQSIPKLLLFDAQGYEVLNHDGYISIDELRPKVEELMSK